MKNIIGLCLLSVLLLTACNSNEDPFGMGPGQVGPIKKTIQMKQIDSLFANDSIVKLSPLQDALGTQGEVEVYEKGGGQMLLISPVDERDPESRIANIQIFDPRYQTDKGITVESTFGQLEQAYTIKSIETTIRSVVVFLENSDLYVTIAKDELPENLRYDPSLKIEAMQIPDEARFKYLMVGWDHDDSNE